MPRSPEYDLVISHLAHQWVSADDLINTLVYKVQPGKAVREYNARYEIATQKASGVAPAKGPLPVDQQQVSGAKTLLRKAIRSAVQAGNVVQSEVGDKTYLRRNFFTAEEVDAILAAGMQDVQVPKVADPEPVVAQPPPDRLIYLDQMMLDIRTVQRVKVTAERGLVSAIIPDVIDSESLHVVFAPNAADWLSDQLGFQALAARKGEENPRKAIRAGTS